MYILYIMIYVYMYILYIMTLVYVYESMDVHICVSESVLNIYLSLYI